MSKGLFGFLDMEGTYDERKVANYKDKKAGLVVDTARVTDSSKKYETAVSHPLYNDRNWVIVELYCTKKQARAGHKKWVKRMTTKKLPIRLMDVSTCTLAKLLASMDRKWRQKDRKVGKNGKDEK